MPNLELAANLQFLLPENLRRTCRTCNLCLITGTPFASEAPILLRRIRRLTRLLASVSAQGTDQLRTEIAPSAMRWCWKPPGRP